MFLGEEIHQIQSPKQIPKDAVAFIFWCGCCHLLSGSGWPHTDGWHHAFSASSFSPYILTWDLLSPATHCSYTEKHIGWQEISLQKQKTSMSQGANTGGPGMR